MSEQITAAASGTFKIGGDLQVNRLGYGAMQLTGNGVWGEPNNPDEAVRVLRRAVELGVTLIDTADSYGPFISDMLIKKALHPYNDDLVIATKSGLARTGPNVWVPIGRPEYLRQQAELSLRYLGLERIDLFQLHRVDPKVPLEEQIGELALMQKEGKIRHIGLSEVSVEVLKAASEITKIASVQNLYNLAKRDSEPVLEYAEANGIAFIPWFPLATGELAREGSILGEMANRLNVKPAQLALAWLLKRSKVMLPIPGTSSVSHVEENIAASGITLSDEDFNALSKLA
ncbi:aldo/keto reductase [Cohnella lupini]|jgi:aryl-alcohol dehydrogenase-like predicted oxidoreductase|uniref:Aryl-alcohol dehydrogenase-like predicted oxidoreductase n=1 Tax=Cohnella lupini TaxID=1294267 RepID=A0A3D9I2H9_9BACL|nr:aldo/keto reductase [Cohnella lupini]RED55992.1 aryl-alcohol dehydrogenase-like predicted oxidoreductase [Cohnella lupini]